MLYVIIAGVLILGEGDVEVGALLDVCLRSEWRIAESDRSRRRLLLSMLRDH